MDHKPKKPKMISLGKYLLRTAIVTGVGAALIGYLLYLLIGTKQEDLYIAVGLAIGMGMILGVTLSLLNYRRFIAPMRRIISCIDQVADGNLSTRINENKVGELGPVASSFNQLINHWEQLITSIQVGAKQLTDSAQVIYEASAHNSEASMQVAATTEELNAHISKQLNTLHIGSEAVAMTKSELIALEKVTSDVQQTAEKATISCKDGALRIHDTIAQLEQSKQAFSSLGAVIQQLAIHSSKVNEVTSMIGEIAEQTNLLALNAAIEAARAGEHGRGFAIVADEVRKLADESRSSSIQIESIIAGILHEIEAAESKIKDSASRLVEGIESMQVTSSSFNNISADINSILNETNRLYEVEQKVVTSSNEMDKAFSYILEASQVTASRLEMFSASVEEQAASLQSIDRSINGLSQLASELTSEVSKINKA